MQSALIFQLLVLLTVANGMPVIAKKFLATRSHAPWRAAQLWRTDPPVRVLENPPRHRACGAGDRGLSRGARPWLEAWRLAWQDGHGRLFPLLACRLLLPLTLLDIGVAVVLFVVGELVVSRILFNLHVRDRPY